MDQPDSEAEYAHKLYSYLDSTGGSYYELIEEFESIVDLVDQVDRNNFRDALSLLRNADEDLEEATTEIDTIVLADENVNYDGEGSMEFTDNIQQSTLRSVKDKIENAESNIDQALTLIDELEKPLPEIDFGAYSDVKEALEYLYSELQTLLTFADNMI